MEQYYEQTVSAEENKKGKLLMFLSWILIAAFLLLALVFGSMILGTAEDGGMRVNWTSAIVLALCFCIAFVIWRQKDRFRIEYDYAIRDGRLEAAAVLNNRRRAQKLNVEINRIVSCGPGRAPSNLKAEKLWLNEGAKLVHVCYDDRDGRKLALLELNEEMTNALKSSPELQRGAWRE